LYAYMFTHPGGKLLFMGNEFGSTSEWNYKSELPWELLQHDSHSKLKDCVRDLCWLYRNEPALYEKQFSNEGFEWGDLSHRDESVISFYRKGIRPEDDLLIIFNMTPVPRTHWKVYPKGKTAWKEIFNSDDKKYWGTGDTYNPSVPCKLVDEMNATYEVIVHLPPLGAVVLK
jgi:1,4-alpha-glucan branching enzyme